MAIFDEEAHHYDDWYDTKMGKFGDQVQTKLAFSLFQPKPGMKILDVGCGTGNFSIKLAEMGCEVIGIDKSSKMLKEAKEKIQGSDLPIRFYQMDVYDLDFADESFDGVFSMAAFEFIKQPKKAYAEMYRVLKKERNLLIGTINRISEWGELYLSAPMQEGTVYQYADFKTLEEVKSWNPEEIVDSGEALFIPPNTKEEEIGWALEKELSTENRGGFVCVLWKKGK